MTAVFHSRYGINNVCTRAVTLFLSPFASGMPAEKQISRNEKEQGYSHCIYVMLKKLLYGKEYRSCVAHIAQSVCRIIAVNKHNSHYQ